MKGFVKIRNGSYRNTDVTNQVFPLVKDYQLGANGGFITVDGSSLFGRDTIRVKVNNPSEFEIVDGSEYGYTVPVVEVESDKEIIERIAERFSILHDMTKAAIAGSIRSMIVSGPPGVGKSYGVERELEKSALFDNITDTEKSYTIVKGSASAIGLYKTLYNYSDAKSVIVFDDCDAILLDDVSLNLLKGALDSGKSRRISWLSESRVLKDEGIPSSFNFKGSVIFITNLKFDKMKSQKLRDHLDALQSRCHYLDLTLDTMRDKILRIKQIALTGELFQTQGISQIGQDEIIDFLDTNQEKLREVSLRMAVKLAELYVAFPARWESVALSTCVKA